MSVSRGAACSIDHSIQAMARLPRLSVPGFPHLLIQQGHSRQPVFKDDVDRAHFLDFLGEACKACDISLHAYALLDTEIRLLATPQAAEGLSKMMQTVGRRYGGSFNRR